MSKRTKILSAVAIVIAILGIIFLIGLMLSGISRWYDGHRLIIKTPIILQSPVQVEKRVPEIVMATVEKPQFEDSVDVVEGYIRSREYGYILWNIYGLESGYGKNDGCLDKGLQNGFGYAPGTCYGGVDEVTNLVNDWFEKRLVDEKLSLPEAICYYNTGTIQSNCPYYQSYLKLTL